MAVYALITGINYYDDPENTLRGCINDANDFEQLCLANGVPKENIIKMTDDPVNKGTALYPTKENYFKQLDALHAKAQSGDTFFISYSGHGCKVNSKVQATYTADGLFITDKELHDRVARVKKGVQVASVLDCCHSADMLDLYNSIDVPPTGKNDPNHGYVMMLSGCQVNQTSADAFLRDVKKKKPAKLAAFEAAEGKTKREVSQDVKGVKRYRGALTAAFMELVGNKGLKYALDTAFSGQLVLMRQFRDKLYTWLKQGGFDQKPSMAYEGTLPAQRRELEPQPVVVAFDRSKLRQRGADGRVAKVEPEARKKATLKK